MSTMMRPSGPLPPRVYWTRRLLLLAVLVLVVILLGWLATRGSSGATATGADGPAGSNAPAGDRQPVPTDRPGSSQPGSWATVTTPHPDSTWGTSNTHGGGPAHRHHHSKSPNQRPHRPRGPGDRSSGPARTPTVAPSPPLARPTGPCDPTKVALSVNVADMSEGGSNTATLVLTSLDAPACTLAVTPGSLVVQVTSGPDVVWTSSQCPDNILAKRLVVRKDPPSAYQFTWNGHRSTDHCRGRGAVAKPGGYWLEVALVGGDPHKAYFEVTAKKPSPGTTPSRPSTPTRR